MTLTQHLLTKNDCYKSGRTITPSGIMVHSLGVAQPGANVFLTNWNQSGVEKCVHAFVAQDGVYQTLPWNRRGWHAGKGTSGTSANNTHIGFEICEPAGHTYKGGTMIGYDAAANEDYFRAVWDNAVALCVLLCKEYGLDPLTDIICHCEGYEQGIASNHADVMQWFPKHGESMDTFRQAVKTEMEESDMTQEQFNTMMGAYLAGLGELEPSDWSAEHRAWAEVNGLIQGDENGNKLYKKFCTREELMTFFHRFSQL